MSVTYTAMVQVQVLVLAEVANLVAQSAVEHPQVQVPHPAAPTRNAFAQLTRRDDYEWLLGR